MDNAYNPFSDVWTKEIQFGTINFQHDMGIVYVSHRRPEHVYKKKGAFCISLSELEICHKEHVYWILLMYENANGETIPHRIKLSELRLLEQHDNNGDKQVIIPIKYMEKRVEEQWKC